MTKDDIEIINYILGLENPAPGLDKLKAIFEQFRVQSTEESDKNSNAVIK